MARTFSGIEIAEINTVQLLKSGDKGPNIIFLHNAGQVPLGMTEHIANLAEIGQVIAPNIFDLIRSLQLRGNKNPSFADVFNEFYRLDLLDKKSKSGIVASSFGGSMAWEYAVEKPNEIEWIVAGSPTGWPLKRSLVEWMWAFAREFFLPPNPRIPENLRRRNPGSGMMMKRFKADPKSVLQGLKLSMTADQREQMKSIKSPVDLLWGSADNYIPPWTGMEMLRLIPNSRLSIVSDYNHLWFAVEPEKLTNPAIARANS